MINAVIFDMDGVLIDSEPLWRKTYIHVFKTVGIELTEEMCRQVTGFRVDMVVDYWFHRFPWEGTTKKQVEEEIWEYITQIIKEEGEIKDGVKQVLEFVKKLNVKIALASTSAMVLINTVIDKLDIREYFEVIHSAEFEEYPKPHPGIYITTAKKLNVDPQFCLAIEDSITGIIASKAAKMKCIAVPDHVLIGDKKLGIADVVLASLAEFNQQVWSRIDE